MSRSLLLQSHPQEQQQRAADGRDSRTREMAATEGVAGGRSTEKLEDGSRPTSLDLRPGTMNRGWEGDGMTGRIDERTAAATGCADREDEDGRIDEAAGFAMGRSGADQKETRLDDARSRRRRWTDGGNDAPAEEASGDGLDRGAGTAAAAATLPKKKVWGC